MEGQHNVQSTLVEEEEAAVTKSFSVDSEAAAATTTGVTTEVKKQLPSNTPEATGEAMDEDEEVAQEEAEVDEEVEEEEEEYDEEEDEEEGEEEDEQFEFDPEASTAAGKASKGTTIIVSGRVYPRTALVRNKGFAFAEGRLCGSPKSTFTACAINRPHNVLSCNAIHFNNRAVLIGDRYVRLNMLVNNPAKENLLSNPTKALHMKFCDVKVGGGHDAEACGKLHLLPNIVFIGVPGLRTAYYEAEIHHNLAFTNLLKEPEETQCGIWCRAHRSHVVTTCNYLHYNRGPNYTERPNPPGRPNALIPDLTPKRPPQEWDSNSGRGRGRGRGHGRGGGGRGRGGSGRGGRGGRGGGRGRGRGSRGGSNLKTGIALPEGLQKQKQSKAKTAAVAASQKAMEMTAQMSREEGLPGDEVAAAPVINSTLLNVLFMLLAAAIVLVAIIANRP